MGLRAHANGDLEAARFYYESVLAIDSNSVTANGWLGTIEAQRKNFSKARVLLERALSGSNDPDFLLNYANLLQETCEYQQALVVYMKVIKKRRNQVSLSNLAACHNGLNQSEQGLRCADESVAIDPNYAEAWSNRGIALNDLKRHEEALASHQRAIELKPDLVEALNNRGVALNDLKRHEEALASYQRATELKPDYAEAWSNRGNALLDLERHGEALASCDRAIELKPDYAEAWSNRGLALNDLKRHEEALASHQRAIELKPDYAEAWSNRGLALNDLKRHEEAFSSYERAIELKPDYAEAWSNRGLALNDLKRLEEALASYQRAIDLKPDLVEAWSNRGVALNDLKRHEEALVNYQRAIELEHDYAEAWSNCGIALNDLKRHEEAFASYERAIELNPDYAGAWSNRGIALGDLKRHEEAFASYERAIELKPDYAEGIYNKGLLQLAQKDFLRGFKNYLRRWETKDFLGRAFKTGLPPCNQARSEENLLLWAEQGIGDEVFYAGFLPIAIERFPNILLVADVRLHTILSRSFPNVTLFKRNQTLESELLDKIAYQAPVGDLGHILGLGSDAIKSTRRPFLIADEEKRSKLKLLAPFTNGKTICGLAWRSHNKHFGEEKSIGLEQLEPILRSTQFEFINLQYGEVDPEIQKVRSSLGVNIHQIEGIDVYNDIDGLLALIDACDIVITTSNLTAHLAGSIGKRGCVFVPVSKGKIWYWHLDDADSFWYPSLKVFHQFDRHDWTDTIRQAKTWIERDVSWKQ